MTVDDLKQSYRCHKCEDNHKHQAKKNVNYKKKSINENLKEKESKRKKEMVRKMQGKMRQIEKETGVKSNEYLRGEIKETVQIIGW